MISIPELNACACLAPRLADMTDTLQAAIDRGDDSTSITAKQEALMLLQAERPEIHDRIVSATPRDRTEIFVVCAACGMEGVVAATHVQAATFWNSGQTAEGS